MAALGVPGSALAFPGSPFNPQSPQAAAIAGLFVLVLVLSGIVFVIVEGLLFYAVFRFRARPDAGPVRQIAGHRHLEIAWTAAPIVLLAIVFAFMLPALAAIDTPAAAAPDARPVRVTVIGHQWWWEYRYPDLGIVTANELHIPTGTPVELDLRSDDVIHSFWVPELNGKLDLVPGRVNRMILQADRPGRYGGQCAEFCGIQHAWMLAPVVAEAPDDFAVWAQGQQAPPPAPVDPLARRGQELFLTKSCVNCHAIAGTPAEARVGPDLSHLATRQTIGAGVLPNTPDDLAHWVTDVRAVKPGARMTGFDLPPDDLAALIAYFQTLRPAEAR